MKTQLLIGAALLVASSLLAADPKDEVKSAAKKLADAGSYSWKSVSEPAMGGGQARPTEGKFANGLVQLSMPRRDNTMEAYLKGEKGAVQTQDGWQSLAELAQAGQGGGGGQGGQGRGFGMRGLQNYKAPAATAAELVDKVKELKKDGDVYTGELTADGVKSLMAFGGRPGGNGPEIANPKGSAKFWVKDGKLTKYEYNVKGTMSFNNNDRDIDRTTTIEISNIGSTKIEVPAAAKSKLDS